MSADVSDWWSDLVKSQYHKILTNCLSGSKCSWTMIFANGMILTINDPGGQYDLWVKSKGQIDVNSVLKNCNAYPSFIFNGECSYFVQYLWILCRWQCIMTLKSMVKVPPILCDGVCWIFHTMVVYGVNENKSSDYCSVHNTGIHFSKYEHFVSNYVRCVCVTSFKTDVYVNWPWPLTLMSYWQIRLRGLLCLIYLIGGHLYLPWSQNVSHIQCIRKTRLRGLLCLTYFDGGHSYLTRS